MRAAIGEDCAVIGKPTEARWTLLKTDVVVEGVHFSPDEDLRRVGWKAVCRAISDIASMGGVPEFGLVTIVIPPKMDLELLRRLYAGIKRAASAYGVTIVGGETSRSPGALFCSIALTGSVERKRCVFRSGGQPMDAIFVTGRLGGSLASGRHLDFKPRLYEARWLTSHFKVHSMMDLSDGIASDLPRLARASNCEFDLCVEKVPVAPRCTVKQALCDGEDFELLFTAPASDARRIACQWTQAFPKLRLSNIGTLKARGTVSKNPLEVHGFDHFA